MIHSDLGDLLRALSAMEPADLATQRAIAELLGFGVAERSEEKTSGAASIESPPAEMGQRQTPPAVATGGAASDERTRPVKVRHFDAPESSAPNWITDPSQPGLETRSGKFEPSHPPLIAEAQSRGVLTTLLSTASATGPIDLEPMIERAAQRLPILEVARRPWPTLARGVQLLLDRSETMAPFFADQAQLEQSLVGPVGRDRVRVETFEHLPHSWFPPQRGTVVLAVTDVGIGRPRQRSKRASAESWLAFAQRVARSGCPLVVLIPYPRQRCPHALLRAMTVIAWDRSTTASRVRRLVGAALRVPGGAV